MNGRITNFTLEGDTLRLTAFLSKEGKTRYALDLSFIEGEMDYGQLVEALKDLKHDIDEVLDVRQQFARNDDDTLAVDEYNRLIPLGMAPENAMIRVFEEMWAHAHE